MKKLSREVESVIQLTMAANSRYVLPRMIAIMLDNLVQEEHDIATKYLESALASATPVASDNGKWNSGWGENLALYTETSDFRMLAPLYTGKLPYIRLLRRLYKVTTRTSEKETCQTLEHLLFSELYDSVIESWIASSLEQGFPDAIKTINIVEIGCGSCQHIPRLHARLSKYGRPVKFWVTDWSNSSGLICNTLRQKEGIDISFKKLDLLSDSLDARVFPENAFVYTINALEQLGENSWRTIDWIVKHSPRLVMHFEPVAELLEPHNPIDRFCLEYIERRGYLKGLYGSLKTRESLQEITIQMCRRTFIANAHHENNTFISWMPLIELP